MTTKQIQQLHHYTLTNDPISLRSLLSSPDVPQPGSEKFPDFIMSRDIFGRTCIHKATYRACLPILTTIFSYWSSHLTLNCSKEKIKEHPTYCLDYKGLTTFLIAIYSNDLQVVNLFIDSSKQWGVLRDLVYRNRVPINAGRYPFIDQSYNTDYEPLIAVSSCYHTIDAVQVITLQPTPQVCTWQNFVNGKTPGVYYFEIEVIRGSLNVGLSTGPTNTLKPPYSIEAPIGEVVVTVEEKCMDFPISKNCCYYMTSQAGLRYENLCFVEYGSKTISPWKASENDVIGCEVDFKKRTISYYLNGTCLGPAYQDIPTDENLYPVVVTIHCNTFFKMNFGSRSTSAVQKPFKYPPPHPVLSILDFTTEEQIQEKALFINKYFPEISYPESNIQSYPNGINIYLWYPLEQENLAFFLIPINWAIAHSPPPIFQAILDAMVSLHYDTNTVSNQIKVLRSQYEPTNSREGNTLSPLHVAAAYNNVDFLKYFVSKFVQHSSPLRSTLIISDPLHPSSLDKCGSTALSAAIMLINFESTEYLLSLPYTNLRIEMNAIISACISYEMTKLIFEHPQVKTLPRGVEFHNIASAVFIMNLKYNSSDRVTEFLLSQGLDVTAQSLDGIIHHASAAATYRYHFEFLFLNDFIDSII